MGSVYQREGDYEKAYVLYHKYLTLFVEKVSKRTQVLFAGTVRYVLLLVLIFCIRIYHVIAKVYTTMREVTAVIWQPVL